MDKTIPPGAAKLLDFIGDTEAPRGYGTLFANQQHRLPKPLTSMTVDEVIAAGPTWTNWLKPKKGSSAAGRYQFMNATLKGLKAELGLRGAQVFDADLQDRLGYHLLLRRGYADFMAGRLSGVNFGRNLAMEWASFPVLQDGKGAHRQVSRGQSYYAGDGVNKALVSPSLVEAALAAAKAAQTTPPATAPTTPPAAPAPTTPSASPPSALKWVVVAAVIAAIATFAATQIGS